MSSDLEELNALAKENDEYQAILQSESFNGVLSFIRKGETEREKLYRLSVQLNMYGIHDLTERTKIFQFIELCRNQYGENFVFADLSEEHKKLVLDYPPLLCPTPDAPITDYLYF